MKQTSNRVFKTLDRILGLSLISLLSVPMSLLRVLGLLHKTAAPRVVLFCKLSNLGDGLLSLYSLRSFKKANPNVKMLMLAGVKTEKLYRESALFSDVICLRVSGKKGVREIFISGILSVLRELNRAGPIDTYVDMNLYQYFTAFTGYWIRASRRLGFRYSAFREYAFTETIPRRRHAHETDCHYDLLSLMGPLEKDIRPFQYPFLETAMDPARKRLIRGGWNGTVPIAALLPGSNPNWASKRWPLEHYTALIRMMVDHKDTFFVILGQQEEASLGEDLKKEAPARLLNLAGKTNFNELAAILKISALFIGNDSGPMHLACLLGTPCVGIFGPTDEKKWGPESEQSAAVFSNQAECRPCYYMSRMPACTHLKCMRDLSVEKVYHEVRRILDHIRLEREK